MAWLRKAGVSVEQLQATGRGNDSLTPDELLGVTAGGTHARFAVTEKRRAPYPNELSRLAGQQKALSDDGAPLLLVPFVSEVLGRTLTATGWSWADADGNFDLRAPGLLLAQRRTFAPSKPAPKTLPQGSGGLAIIRALIQVDRSQTPSVAELARRARVSQPRASQVLHQLEALGLVRRSTRSGWTPTREPLLDRFLAEYAGPRGSHRYFYGLDPLVEIALRAASTNAPHDDVLLSADVGPDLLVAWRRPSVLVLYVQHDVLPGTLGLVEAQGRHDANVILRRPDDLSVFRVPGPTADVNHSQAPLVDPMQQIWDLQDLGGADRLEAAGMLREWILTRP